MNRPEYPCFRQPHGNVVLTQGVAAPVKEVAAAVAEDVLPKGNP